MLGIGGPDLLFILVLLLLLIKPAEWPTVARKVARTVMSIRRALDPVLTEMRGVRDTLMAESVPARIPSQLPPDWFPSPQGFQKGGEPPDVSQTVHE